MWNKTFINLIITYTSICMFNPSILNKKRRNGKLTRELCANRSRYYKLAYSWTGNGMLADDLVQEAMQKAFLSFDSLQDDQKLNAWTCRILVNCHLDWLRRQKDLVDIDDYEIPENDSLQSAPFESVSVQDTRQIVRDCIAMLNEKHRKVVTLVDLMEFSYEEVSQSLDIPIGTVMSRLCRARAQLRTFLEKHNPDFLSNGSDKLTAPALKRLRSVK